MKRKFKLITSIASLTAAIALLMFGVYAAAARQVSISGTVNFTASNIAARVEVWEYVGPTAIAVDAETGWNHVKTFKYSVNGDVQVLTSSDPTEVWAEPSGSQDLQSVSLDTAENELTDTNLVYQYKVVITSLFSAGGSNIEVSIVSLYDPEDTAWLVEGVTTEFAVGSEDLVEPLPANASSYLFTYTVQPELAPASAEDIDIGATVIMTRANA